MHLLSLCCRFGPYYDANCICFLSDIQMLREEQTNEVVKELVSKGFSYNQIQGMGYMVSQPDSTLAAPAGGATQ